MYAVQGDKETAKKFQHSGLQFCVRNNSRPRRGSGGGRRLSYSPDTDKRLLQWVMDRDKNGLTVSREAIQTQALALIREECPDFKASSGWVEKFLIRHKLCLPTKANMLGKLMEVFLKDRFFTEYRHSTFEVYVLAHVASRISSSPSICYPGKFPRQFLPPAFFVYRTL